MQTLESRECLDGLPTQPAQGDEERGGGREDVRQEIHMIATLCKG